MSNKPFNLYFTLTPPRPYNNCLDIEPRITELVVATSPEHAKQVVWDFYTNGEGHLHDAPELCAYTKREDIDGPARVATQEDQWSREELEALVFPADYYRQQNQGETDERA